MINLFYLNFVQNLKISKQHLFFFACTVCKKELYSLLNSKILHRDFKSLLLGIRSIKLSSTVVYFDVENSQLHVEVKKHY